ncbi:hypothetical protein BCR43DRAFT_481192 [Syncephalastrum racemosum]|uniref:HECT-type E3 ubiquitin transferase n=1 Tax=Syncephalastrum racemosum TaxID=13706 RepID=A0A1X2HRP7_SYNRA|nr:hypothetical protein BCR43DRAFT_481192 [Syncephalastrum racemosum]
MTSNNSTMACEDDIVDDTHERTTADLSLDAIRRLQTMCQAAGNWEPFKERLTLTFGNIHFLKCSFQMKTLKPGVCSVDRIQAQEAFEIIQHEVPENLDKVLLDALKRAIAFHVRSNEEATAELINAVVILFQCPRFLDLDAEDNLVADVWELIASFPHQLQDQLLQYLVENDDLVITKAKFQDLLDRLHQTIRKQLYPAGKLKKPVSPHQDEVVINATKCMAMLYRANEKYDYVHFTEFYDDAINDTLEIKVDFPNYKEAKGKFSFCDYPFILNPAVKADILKVESVFQMRHELQDAFFRALFEGVNSPYLILNIRRDRIVHDTLLQLERKSIHDLKKQLRVQFVGEEGVDEGGVQKEFFQLLIRELFDPNYGMFRMNEESRIYWFAPDPSDVHFHEGEFGLAGLLLGLAVYNSVILDLHLPLALYKKLMDIPVGLSDLQQLDPALANGLEHLLQLDEEDFAAIGRTFQIDIESVGKIYSIDLKPDGSAIPLTKENCTEFVDLYVQFILARSVEKQFSAFRRGFDLLCQDNAINIFRPEEIEQVICGSSHLDFYALEAATVYDGGWCKDSPIIKHFWEIVHDFSEDEKKKLLFFATGSDRAPIGGLGKLQFVIAKNGADSDRLPTSHTCYNVLLLCEYSSKEKLRERLLTSISNAEGFGMI